MKFQAESFQLLFIMPSNKILVLLLLVAFISFRTVEVKDSAINENVRMLIKKMEELSRDFDIIKEAQLNNSAINVNERMLMKKLEEVSRDFEVIKKTQLNNSVAITNILAKTEYKLPGTITNTLVKLNVGGKEFETTVITLRSINNTYFTSLFSQINQVKLDDKGRIFIDRNGDLFSYILDYLRTGKFHLVEDRRLRLLLIDEAEYYQLNSLLSILDLFKGGSLLDITHQGILNDFSGVRNQQWQLIYKATKHGFDVSTFHTLCDNKGPTMTVIKSQNGYLFGGFTKESWAGAGSFKIDSTAFIFTLTNPHGIAANKFIIKDNQQHAIYADAAYGPTFGGGHDINGIHNCKVLEGNCYTNFPSTYKDTTGKGTVLFTGNYKYAASDIEVYGLANY